MLIADPGAVQLRQIGVLAPRLAQELPTPLLGHRLVSPRGDWLVLASTHRRGIFIAFEGDTISHLTDLHVVLRGHDEQSQKQCKFGSMVGWFK